MFEVTRWEAYTCICLGLWSSLIIGFATEYFTSNDYEPTIHLAQMCENGPALSILFGISQGYMSCIIPVLVLAFTISYSASLAGIYGISLAAMGMLSCLPVSLTIDGYGPICDNAGGLA